MCLQMMYTPADDMQMMYPPVDDVRMTFWMTYMPADDMWMMYLPADDVPDDVLDDICHPLAKSPMKSHSRVICTSSAHRRPVVRMRLQPPKYLQLNTRATALLKMNEMNMIGD